MKIWHALPILLLAGGVSQACTPWRMVDDTGHELQQDKQVEVTFAASKYVIVGDVIQSAERAEEYVGPNGRPRRRIIQEATILVRKSWKSSKREGEALKVLTDLSDSCSERIELGSQILVYADGSEPVSLERSDRISDLGFASSDVAILDGIAVGATLTSGAPNKPLHPTRETRGDER